MKIHFLLLALVAFVALSQHNVDARVDGLSSDGFRSTRTLAEHRLLDHFLKRSLYGLEESNNEENEKDQESEEGIDEDEDIDEDEEEDIDDDEGDEEDEEQNEEDDLRRSLRGYDILPEHRRLKEHTCAQQAAWGKCGRSWMQGRCCRECGGCRSSRRL